MLNKTFNVAYSVRTNPRSPLAKNYLLQSLFESVSTFITYFH